MHNLPISASSIESGFLWGVVFYLLRLVLDTRRGVLVELATVTGILGVTLPICSILSRNEAGAFQWFFTLHIEIIFLATFFLCAVRIIERLMRSGALHIHDIFRLTTVGALTSFCYSGLALHTDPLSVGILVLMLLLIERSIRSPFRSYWVAASFSLGFIFASLNAALRQEALQACYCPEWMWLDPWNLRRGFNLISLLGFITGFLLAPRIMANIFWSLPMCRLAHYLTAMRLSWGAPKDLIHYKPPIDLWFFPEGVVYLNHGSFGATPISVRIWQEAKRRELMDQPMDYLARKFEKEWLDARFRLAMFLGTKDENIAFVENATAGMNEIASSFPLQAGDEILINDHEYGAVRRIWERRCNESQAKLTSTTLPLPVAEDESQDQIIGSILDACTPRTRMVILSHITSPTALRLPVERLCSALRERKVAVCIDGPHAPNHVDLHVGRLECDFYTASCHKWLCAPVGSGFVYADPKWHSTMRSSSLSWGRLPPTELTSWTDELLWTGTRDSSAYLAVPEAIRFFQDFGSKELSKLQERNHLLACYARERLLEIPGTAALAPESSEWMGWMAAVWLPPGDHSTLQQRLWEDCGIETPIVHFADRYLIRVSCHLYNTTHDIETLKRALIRQLES